MRELSMTPFRLMSPLLAAALLLAMAACSRSPSTESAPTEAEGAEAPTESEAGIAPVKLDAAAMKAAGIVVQALQPASMSEQLRAPGEVLDNAYGTALITPSVEALVVRRHAKLGDEVRTGTPLVTLSSVEVANAQADLRIAEQEWRRVSALGREAVSGRRINEAQVALDRARATAQAYGLPGTAAGRSNGQFTLTAPHAGRITEDAVVVVSSAIRETNPELAIARERGQQVIHRSQALALAAEGRDFVAAGVFDGVQACFHSVLPPEPRIFMA